MLTPSSPDSWSANVIKVTWLDWFLSSLFDSELASRSVAITFVTSNYHKSTHLCDIYGK